MKAKLLLCTAAIIICTTVLAAEAQQSRKVHRIGLLISSSTNATAPYIEAFRHGLRELGYIEGKNIVLEIRGGGAKPDRVSDLAAELVGLKVDIIVAGGSFAARAAKEAMDTVPIVMRVGFDPIKAGFIASLARPGGISRELPPLTLG